METEGFVTLEESTRGLVFFWFKDHSPCWISLVLPHFHWCSWPMSRRLGTYALGPRGAVPAMGLTQLPLCKVRKTIQASFPPNSPVPSVGISFEDIIELRGEEVWREESWGGSDQGNPAGSTCDIDPSTLCPLDLFSIFVSFFLNSSLFSNSDHCICSYVAFDRALGDVGSLTGTENHWRFGLLSFPCLSGLFWDITTFFKKK